MGAWGRVRVLDGPIAGTVFHLDRPVHCMGRAAESDLRVPDATVSRKQAELRCGGDGVLLVGLSDKNPLWVNGEPLEGPRRLVSGDKFQAGLVHFEFEGGESAPRSVPVVDGAVTMLAGASAPGAASPRHDLRCPRCGAKDLPGARYCGACGAALQRPAEMALPTVRTLHPAPGAAPPPPPAPPPAPDTGNHPPVKRSRTQTMGRPAELMPQEAQAGLILKGRFELRRELGAGRATQVYSAFDRARNLEVAVKVLRPEAAAHRDARDQFFHSSNAFVVAKHPNLVRVEDVHEEGDLCFAVMELLPGLRLREQIRARPATAGGYPAAEARLVGAALCGALEALHTVGVHGNVRPENVWITPQGIVKLLDPGLLPPQGGSASWITGPGDLEAAFYSAPEVLQGSPPDAMSDQYSVAAVLYHMLAGEPAAGRVEPLRGSRRGFPDGLARAVDRGLSAAPGDRFPSLAEFGRALGSASGGAGPGRGLVAAGIAAGVLALAASSLLWFPPARDALRSAKKDRAAEDRATALREEAALAEAKAREQGEFADAEALGRARSEREKGDAALAGLRHGEAVLAFLDSKGLFEAEAAAARARKDARGRADLAAAAWAAAERTLETAAAPLERLADLEAALPAAEGADGGGGPAARPRREREAATVRTRALAADLRKAWEQAGAGPEFTKAREAAEKARSLQAERRDAEAEPEWRRGAMLLHRAVAEARDALVQRALAEGGLRTIRGMDEARKRADDAALAGGAGDLAAAAARWKEAADAWADLLAPALAGAAEKFLRDEVALRCQACASDPGRCPACGGSKVESRECPKCAGKGDRPADCPRCSGAKKETCPQCAGAKAVSAACAACGGIGKRLCAACRGVPADCPSCKGDGKAKCLRCKGTGRPTAMGEKAVCPDCDGTGSIPCPECKGEKKRACTTCGGTPETPCSACGATGKVTGTCPGCGGEGNRDCAACAGSGIVRVPCGECEGGRVTAPCPKCKGEGTCPACEGQGRKE